MVSRVEKALPLAVALGVIGVWALSGVLLSPLEKRGEIGDMFGAVNALFSGLAFAGVTYAIVLQRKELRLQRKELNLTRRELEGQRIALNAQNDTLRHQNFESTFFQLLRVLEDIVHGIGVQRSRHSIEIERGRDAFPILFSKLRDKWASESAQPVRSDLERVKRAYGAFYSENEADLGHYFRTLYNIVKLVDRSALPDKKLYTNLIRAQLSSFELVLLLYNCISDMGREKFKPLIERYALLKTVPQERLLDSEKHLALFEPSAFG